MARNTWPGWECVRLLGTGSFGRVYEIRRTEFGRDFSAALKVITIPPDESSVKQAYSEGMDDASVTAYFRSYVEDITAEFAVMAQLKGHTNIVSYEDHMVLEQEGRIGWDILIRMELLTPLLEWASLHPLTETDVIRLGIDMCRALEICHNLKILHRDIKPENIYLNQNGDYKLGDFGIAKQTVQTLSAHSQKGTYTYMAPEVYKGKPYDSGADLYSLGIVLYRFLNGQRTPFLPQGTIKFNDREEARRRRMDGEAIPPPLYGSEMLRQVVLKAVAYEREDRYENASEMRAALEACLAYCEEHSDSLSDSVQQPQPEPSGDSVPETELTKVLLPQDTSEQSVRTATPEPSEEVPKPAPLLIPDANPNQELNLPDLPVPMHRPRSVPAAGSSAKNAAAEEAVREAEAPGSDRDPKRKWVMPAAICAGVLLLAGGIALAGTHGIGTKDRSSSAAGGKTASVSSSADSSGSSSGSSSSSSSGSSSSSSSGGSSSSSAADSSSKQSESSATGGTSTDFNGDDWEIQATSNMLMLGDSTNIMLYSSVGGQWTITNAPGMTWSSSDESVLKVSPGVVTAVGTGAAKVNCDIGQWHYEWWYAVADAADGSATLTTDLENDTVTVREHGSKEIVVTASAGQNLHLYDSESVRFYYYIDPAPADEDLFFSFHCKWHFGTNRDPTLTVSTLYAATGTRKIRVMLIDVSDMENLRLLAEKEITVQVG